LADTLQRECHKLYGSPPSVTWMELLRKQMNTGTPTSPTAETHWSTRTRIRALSRNVTQRRLSNVTCAWSWRICGISPAIPSYIFVTAPTRTTECSKIKVLQMFRIYEKELEDFINSLHITIITQVWMDSWSSVKMEPFGGKNMSYLRKMDDCTIHA
jgi:hypothetical protein